MFRSSSTAPTPTARHGDPGRSRCLAPRCRARREGGPPRHALSSLPTSPHSRDLSRYRDETLAISASVPSSVVTIAVLHTFPERAVDRKRKRVDLIYYLTEGRVQGWRISSPSSHFFRAAPTGVPRRLRPPHAAIDLAVTTIVLLVSLGLVSNLFPCRLLLIASPRSSSP